ncbi:MAG: toll/interleukin-1 receptor domain-containing protein [Verrucomicrobiales bacterium]|nr:toll/interleukin-1 receptor domain-containing protein [Verrucomicrobiales bacterium]
MKPNAHNPLYYLYNYFISFSSSDLVYARSLAELLFSMKCLSCWYDRESIESSKHFPTEIAKGLEQSRQMIVLVSDNSVASDWVISEVWSMLSNDPRNRAGKVIPISLDGTKLPGPLRQLQTLDASGGFSMELIDSVVALQRRDL